MFWHYVIFFELFIFCNHNNLLIKNIKNIFIQQLDNNLVLPLYFIFFKIKIRRPSLDKILQLPIPKMIQRRIQKLDAEVAEQITSQQIIPSLHQCVKQLVDNSIDARATLIRIELIQYGKQFFSVYDNGSGIRDVSRLGQGGNTSKLKIKNLSEDYLQGIRTLGFRGQAVNSIAKLCKQMSIHTVFVQHILNDDKNINDNENSDNRIQQSDIKPKLKEVKYSVTNKKIIQQKYSLLPQTFTLISVQSLFYNLPVRRHQLQTKTKQNIKNVYELVFEISIIYPEITFILVNIVNGKEQLILQLQRNIGMYGRAKKKVEPQYSNNKVQQVKKQQEYFYPDILKQAWLQRICICFPKKLDDCLVFIKSLNVQGFILGTIDSGSSKKNTRFNKNYQYTFLNRRPINPLKQICKIFDTMYKKYNPYTKYVFFLNLKVSPAEIDINLSPNKRDIYVKTDRLKQILSQIKNLIQKQVIQKIVHLEDYKILKEKKQAKSQNYNEIKQQNSQSDQDYRKSHRMSQQQSLKNKRKTVQKQDNIKIRQQVFRSGISQQTQQRSMKGNYLANYRAFDSLQPNKTIQELNQRINQVDLGSLNKKYIVSPPINKDNRVNQKQKFEQYQQNSQSFENRGEQHADIKKTNVFSTNKGNLKDQIYSALSSSINPIKIQEPMKKNKQSINRSQNSIKQQVLRAQNSQKSSKFNLQNSEQHNKPTQKSTLIDPQIKLQQINTINQCQIKCPTNSHKQKQIQQNHNQSHGKEPLKSQYLLQQSSYSFRNLNYIMQQRKGQIKKNDFANFHIHGQFNKGFILASLNQKQYFYIIDQHAAEQKRLFQTFMQSKPTYYHLCKQIKITPFQVDNIQTAQQNLINSGFTFKIQNRNTLKIIRCPMYFRVNFGQQAFMSIAQNNKNIKQIPLFYNTAASRACRSAVMIGDHLQTNQMVNIVHRMSDLKSPWNCPHGRPSLISLGSFKSKISNIKIKNKKRIF